MVAYNFMPRFASLVESGEKRQTIRREGKRIHADRGDKVHLFTGMRTKDCRKLGEGVCIQSAFVTISETGAHVNGVVVSNLDPFARRDGFRDFDEMKAWFRDTHGLPFTGRLIQWTLATTDRGA